MRDDKVLADSNGMMIAALANAGACHGVIDWIIAAQKAFTFITTTMAEGDRLFHSWRDGKLGHIGFADDYAQMAHAALALFEATSDQQYLEWAKRWTRVLNTVFWDEAAGGYCQTAADDTPLIQRVRSVYDQAVPSANGVMVGVQAKLYMATGDTSHRDRAGHIIGAFAGDVGRSFLAMGTYLNGLETLIAGLQIVVIGPRDAQKTRELVTAVLGRSLPNRLLMVVDPAEGVPEGHPAYGKTMENGQPTAYVCQHQNCSAPIASPVTLSQVLQLPARPPQPGQRPQ
jgi:uncharacterized protein